MEEKNMKTRKNDPLLRYCEWVSKRVNEDVLIGALCVSLLIAAFAW